MPDEPSVPIDERDSPAPAVRREFWVLVAVFNLAVLGIGAGAMLLYFEVRQSLGVGTLLIGIAAFAYGYGRYRRFQSTE